MRKYRPFPEHSLPAHLCGHMVSANIERPVRQRTALSSQRRGFVRRQWVVIRLPPYAKANSKTHLFSLIRYRGVHEDIDSRNYFLELNRRFPPEAKQQIKDRPWVSSRWKNPWRPGQFSVEINSQDSARSPLSGVSAVGGDKAAALKFLKRIMKKYGQPKSVDIPAALYGFD